MSLVNKILLEAILPKVFYHVTPLWVYNEKIKQEGLVPSMPVKRNRYYSEQKGVHLLKSLNQCKFVAKQLFSSKRKSKKNQVYAILKIDATKLNQKNFSADDNFGKSNFAFVYNGIIPPKYITLIESFDVLEYWDSYQSNALKNKIKKLSPEELALAKSLVKKKIKHPSYKKEEDKTPLDKLYWKLIVGEGSFFKHLNGDTYVISDEAQKILSDIS